MNDYPRKCLLFAAVFSSWFLAGCLEASDQVEGNSSASAHDVGVSASTESDPNAPPTLKAFEELPNTLAVPRGVGSSTSQWLDKDESYEYRFSRPAHFPLRRYEPHGVVADRDGVIIYEGMRFSTDASGRYEVECVVQSPAIPTTLRLQIRLMRNLVDNDPIGENLPWYTLTLPPIHLDASISEPDRPRVHRIYHAGYSPVLHRPKGCLSCDEAAERMVLDCPHLQRRGTATFGFDASQFREGLFSRHSRTSVSTDN